jgi:hypothetical protein
VYTTSFEVTSKFFSPMAAMVAMYGNKIVFWKKTGFSGHYGSPHPQPSELKFTMKLSF